MSGTFQGRIAYASVSPIGGPIGAQIDRQSGDFASVSALGAGVFELVLSDAIDPDEAVYVATTTGKDGHSIQVWRAACTDTTVRVQTRNAAGALNGETFDLAILVKPLV